MSQTTQPPNPQSPPPTTDPNVDRYRKVLSNTAIFALIACPALALLPPRKLDAYTFGLIGMTGFSANYVVQERSGRSITQHLGLASPPSPLEPSQTAFPSETPKLPPTIQQRLGRNEGGDLRKGPGEESAATGPVSEELQSHRAAWKVQREKEIKEEVEEGKSFQDMIIDQVWEVWTWGKSKKDDDDE